jgi:hypothetical protein
MDHPVHAFITNLAGGSGSKGWRTTAHAASDPHYRDLPLG